MSQRDQDGVFAVADEFIEDGEEVEWSAGWTLEKIIFMLAGIGIAVGLAAAAFAAGIGWILLRRVFAS